MIPGPGVSLAECAEIALLVRDILRDIGHDPVPVTSGSKGIHLYAPLDGSQSTEEARRSPTSWPGRWRPIIPTG